MSVTWDKKTGRLTLEDGRYIILTGEDAESFDQKWYDHKEDRDILVKEIVRSKHSIHYPPRNP